MPSKISKEVALENLSKERMNLNDCLICEILKNTENENILYQDNKITAFLSKYPRFWGHSIIATNEHIINISDIPEELFYDCFRLSKQIATLQEKELNPANIYISSIGSAENHLNTCSHFHIHILPIYNKEIKPSKVFTWNEGIYQGTKREWEKLRRVLIPALLKV